MFHHHQCCKPTKVQPTKQTPPENFSMWRTINKCAGTPAYIHCFNSDEAETIASIFSLIKITPIVHDLTSAPMKINVNCGCQCIIVQDTRHPHSKTKSECFTVPHICPCIPSQKAPFSEPMHPQSTIHADVIQGLLRAFLRNHRHRDFEVLQRGAHE